MTDYADLAVVNERDEVIGEMQRDDLIKQGGIYRLSTVVVLNPDAQIYLQQRADTVDSDPGKWDFSASGHVDAGETYQEAALREAKEELNLSDLSLHKLTHFYKEDEFNGQPNRRFRTVFKSLTRQEPRIDQDEVKAGRWMTRHEFEESLQKTPTQYAPKVHAIYPMLKGLWND